MKKENSKSIINPLKNAQVCFRLEYFLKEELEFLSMERGLTMSEMLRELIEEKMMGSK